MFSACYILDGVVMMTAVMTMGDNDYNDNKDNKVDTDDN